MTFQPRPLILSRRHDGFLRLPDEERSPVAGGTLSTGSHVPRMVLSSEGWDTADKQPGFLSSC